MRYRNFGEKLIGVSTKRVAMRKLATACLMNIPQVGTRQEQMRGVTHDASFFIRSGMGRFFTMCRFCVLEGAGMHSISHSLERTLIFFRSHKRGKVGHSNDKD